MSIADNKQLVRSFYEAGNRGDFDACFALIADDIRWTNIGSTPLSGTFVGKDVLMEKLLGPLFARLKSGIETRIENLIAEGDLVVALTTGRAETTDGLTYNNRYCQVMRIHDGKIREVTEYFDTQLTDKVFGNG